MNLENISHVYGITKVGALKMSWPDQADRSQVNQKNTNSFPRQGTAGREKSL